MPDQPSWALQTSINGHQQCWPLSAVVFDCDGLLMDSESVWFDMLAAWMKDQRPEVTLPLAQFHGLTVVDTARFLFEHTSGFYENAGEIQQDITQRYSAMLAFGVSLMPGARELIGQLHGRVPIALASNGLREDVISMLKATGLLDFFDAICTLEDVTRGKPHPDIYQLACQKLSVLPNKAIAFEDSPTGVQAASSAGLRVMGISSQMEVELPTSDRFESLEAFSVVPL